MHCYRRSADACTASTRRQPSCVQPCAQKMHSLQHCHAVGKHSPTAMMGTSIVHIGGVPHLPLAQAQPRSQKTKHNSSSTSTSCLNKAVLAPDIHNGKVRPPMFSPNLTQSMVHGASNIPPINCRPEAPWGGGGGLGGGGVWEGVGFWEGVVLVGAPGRAIRIGPLEDGS